VIAVKAGSLGFVEGPVNAEDLARVPGTRWLLASGMVGVDHSQGHLYLVDTVARTAAEIFPDEVEIGAADPRYGCAAAPDVASFDAHGLFLRPGGDTHTLYLVNHGSREAVEVFEVDVSGDRPRLTWVGAIPQAPGVWGNAVAALPDDGIVVTNYLDLGDPDAFAKVFAGEVTGNLKEWFPGKGWSDVPGSECSSPNGVGVSPDGRHYFVNSWSTHTVIRLARDGSRRDEAEVDFLPDNVKWSDDGRVLVAGQVGTAEEVFAEVDTIAVCPRAFGVAAIDPETLEVESVLAAAPEHFGLAATAIEVDDALWISNARGTSVAFATIERS
jgi:hypothetical protein